VLQLRQPNGTYRNYAGDVTVVGSND